MTFRPYDHVERLGHPDVEGIDIGQVHVFPKLDGTNASVWLGEDGRIHAGSRRREVTVDSDNHGFAAWVALTVVPFHDLLDERPSWILYGEWLVPHTLKTYREDAWRRFWIFDVFDRERGRYVPFEEYVDVLHEARLDVVMPLALATNPTAESLTGWVRANTFLLRDGAGHGEGIVLKNYAWTNGHGRQPWAKLVANEFKEQHGKAMGYPTPDGGFQVELAAAEALLTEEVVKKALAKIVHDVAGEIGEYEGPDSAFALKHRSRIIPRLLETVFHDFVVEESWTILRKWKSHQTIDFKRLRAAVIVRTKSLMPEVFG
jgi:hypothetical protein